eukprot:CAMPEP_0201606516 /NCGR_PEP_ID=MMETSP0492-20130828/5941_1 /ASSEMBLY_ACC=CAM_ASM_000837 /TAXON_ID=420259 /ORGANISM="Thalassiosira gravida, Strain GMp14c1" /LENGTH=352 /DNA_ID=CAMNT_0048070937 /DNA_START=78 /DNA_END=1136 /DNA_ORIENTATION=-
MTPTTTIDHEIPKEMKRLIVTSPGAGESVEDITIEIKMVPTPIPAAGEVLVKIAAAPVNPSDAWTWFQSPPSSYPLPIGIEGCGIVVSSESETRPVGSKVGFICDGGIPGSYAEYIAVDALTNAYPMPPDVPIEDCASFMVNPYTAIGILDTAKREGSTTIVHTAAASQLGQMINKLAPKKDMTIINVVRRPEQKALLESLGAKHVIVTNTDVEVWKAELTAKVEELNAMSAFDAVGGELPGHVLDVLPSHGILHMYGALVGPASGINAKDLIYKKKQVKGFYLTDWIREGGMEKIMPRMKAAGEDVRAGIGGPDGWCCSKFKDTTMENMHEDYVKQLGASTTESKMRIRFD